VKEAKADSLDAAFAAVGVPMFVLDVRPAAAPDESIRRWLAVDQPMRMVGAVFDPAWETQAYRPLPPGKAFDAILFTETTTRARPLKAMPHASMGVDPPMNRPRLGVQLAADNQPGIRIDKIMEGYAAEAAGLREGDRILKLNDEDVDSVHGFVSALSKHPTGSVVKVTIKRGEETSVIEVKLTAPKTN
jgi:membrane-associated protease RseP (regulator of RpoE activity)